MKEICAVAFDVDGTLVDSERDGHRRAFNEAFAEAGLSDHWSPSEYGELLATTGGRNRIEAYFIRAGMAQQEARERARRLHARKTEIFRGLVETGAVPAREGVAELLDQLDGLSIRMHVVTTGTRAWVLPLLDNLFGRNRFHEVVTGDDVTQLKPHPEAYQLMLTNTGLDPASVVAVEDSHAGVMAAVGAGLTCWMVTNDYTRYHSGEGAARVGRNFHDVDVRQLLSRMTSPGLTS